MKFGKTLNGKDISGTNRIEIAIVISAPLFQSSFLSRSVTSLLACHICHGMM
jgi:hypothetical protein